MVGFWDLPKIQVPSEAVFVKDFFLAGKFFSSKNIEKACKNKGFITESVHSKPNSFIYFFGEGVRGVGNFWKLVTIINKMC